jgi:hypothetical protein
LRGLSDGPAHGHSQGFAHGFARKLPTLLVGSDVPDLPPERVRSAVAALRRTDAVLVPSLDGGYVMVGARRPIDALFAIDAPWSSSDVFSATCRSLTKAECPFETLLPWEDVDDAAALGRLAARLDGHRPRGDETTHLDGEGPWPAARKPATARFGRAATAMPFGPAPATASLMEQWRRDGVRI